MDAGPLANLASVADWSRVFRLPDVWRPLVNAVLVRHDLPAADRDGVRPGQTAGTHAVFVVREELVVKIYAPFWRADYGREVGVLRQLAGRSFLGGQVDLPQLIATGELPADAPGSGGRTWPYVITRYVRGTELRQVWERMSCEERNRLGHDLGTALAQLHSLPLPAGPGSGSTDSKVGGRDEHAGSPPYWRGEWERFVAGQIETVQERHRNWGDLPEHLIADLPAFFTRLGGFPVADWQPALLSADVTAEHVLVTRQRGLWRLAGLIDFGDALVGDPEYEFVVAYSVALSLDRSAFAALLAGYRYRCPADLALWRRMLAYFLLHAFPLLRATPQSQRSAVAAARDLDAAAQSLWGIMG